MRKVIHLMTIGSLFLFSCSQKAPNPFLEEYDTPFNTPPFSRIKTEHYLPAIKAGIAEQEKEIAAIADNPQAPTFENTLEEMERSGTLLLQVNNVLMSINDALTNDTIQQISKEVAPMLSECKDNILLNENLFGRVKAIYDNRDSSKLTTEQQMLLKHSYRSFVRGGALLAEKNKSELREINKELSVIDVQFVENILKENNAFELVIENQKDLSGLPEAVLTQAAETAEERGHKGKWVFTLHKPSMIPFLKYSDKRDVREKIFMGYINRGNNNND